VASLQRDDHRALAAAARRHAQALLDRDAALDQLQPRLAAELRNGWLARVAAGEPSGAA
jgi:hypothetical protein